MNDRARAALSDVCQVYIEKDVSLGVEDLAGVPWVSCQDTSVNRGYSSEILWMSLTLSNTSQTANTSYVHFPMPWINSIQVYEEGFNDYREFGSSLPFTDKDIPALGFFIPLTIEPQQEKKIFIRIQSDDALIVDGYWSNELGLINSQIKSYVYIGVIIGGITLLSVYNLLLSFFLRDRSYFYYVLYSLSMLVLCGTVYGFNYQFLWPGSPGFNSFTNSATSGISFAFFLVFARQFLNSQLNFPKLDKWLVGAIVFSIFQVALSFSPIRHLYTVFLAASIATIGTPLILLLAIYAWLKKAPSSQYFLLACSTSLLTTTFFGFYLNGFIQYSQSVYLIVGFGVFFEIGLLSFALADKINVLQHKDTLAQDAALKSQKKYAAGLTKVKNELEQEVEQRTAALQRAKASAEKLAMTDEMTGLNNRRAFFQHGSSHHSESLRFGRIYSVIMLDIDNFKQINDQYGHAAGDEVIVAVSNGIKKTIRAADFAGRIGGEEFAALLPETDQTHALVLAERLRKEFKTIVVVTTKGDIRLTSSFGVAQLRLVDREVDDVLARADEALYQAKEGGRDQVVLFETSP